MVNPSDVFPDSRVDRFFDHQYASLPCQGPPPRVPCGSSAVPPSTIRRSPPGGSVLEALLRSNEPIDPNRGSGAAVGLDATDEHPAGVVGCRGNRKASSAAPQVMMLKRLLMGWQHSLLLLLPLIRNGLPREFFVTFFRISIISDFQVNVFCFGVSKRAKVITVDDLK